MDDRYKYVLLNFIDETLKQLNTCTTAGHWQITIVHHLNLEEETSIDRHAYGSMSGIVSDLNNMRQELVRMVNSVDDLKKYLPYYRYHLPTLDVLFNRYVELMKEYLINVKTHISSS